MRSGVETSSQAFCRIWGTPEKRRRKPVGSRGVEDIRRRPWPTNSTKQSSLGHIESDVQSWTLYGSVLGSLKICSGCLAWSFCGHKSGIRTISDSCLFWGHFFFSVCCLVQSWYKDLFVVLLHLNTLCSFYIPGRPAPSLKENKQQWISGSGEVGWELERKWCGKWRGSGEGKNMFGVCGMR